MPCHVNIGPVSQEQRGYNHTYTDRLQTYGIACFNISAGEKKKQTGLTFFACWRKLLKTGRLSILPTTPALTTFSPCANLQYQIKFPMGFVYSLMH